MQQLDWAKSMCIFWSVRQIQPVLPTTLSMCQWLRQFSIQTPCAFSWVFCLECSNDHITSGKLMNVEHYSVHAVLFRSRWTCSLPRWNTFGKHLAWGRDAANMLFFPWTGRSSSHQQGQELTWWPHWAGSWAAASRECLATTSSDQTGPGVGVMSRWEVRETSELSDRLLFPPGGELAFWIHAVSLTMAAFTDELSILGRRDRGPWDREGDMGLESILMSACSKWKYVFPSYFYTLPKADSIKRMEAGTQWCLNEWCCLWPPPRIIRILYLSLV